ncbi:hypothetical protein [Mucilaginibacter sp.]
MKGVDDSPDPRSAASSARSPASYKECEVQMFSISLRRRQREVVRRSVAGGFTTAAIVHKNMPLLTNKHSLYATFYFNLYLVVVLVE